MLSDIDQVMQESISQAWIDFESCPIEITQNHD